MNTHEAAPTEWLMAAETFKHLPGAEPWSAEVHLSETAASIGPVASGLVRSGPWRGRTSPTLMEHDDHTVTKEAPMNMLLTATACAISTTVGVTPDAVNAKLATMLAPCIAMQDTVDEKVVQGSIKTIAEDRNSIVLTVGEDKEETITVNKQTTFTLDGLESTRELALKTGRTATVTHVDGVASKIDVRTTKSVP